MKAEMLKGKPHRGKPAGDGLAHGESQMTQPAACENRGTLSQTPGIQGWGQWNS